MITGTILLLMVAIAATTLIAQSTTYAGVTFPLGDVSFADRAISYTAASCVDCAYGNPNAALGPPDCTSGTCSGCSGCAPCAVALGFRLSEIDNRGSLVLEFTDNILVDGPGNDLFVYITNNKKCRVEISTDGINFTLVGEVTGYPAAIDIGPYAAANEEFRFVRLSDVPADEDHSPCPGPSIDAVGAMGNAVSLQQQGSDFGSLQLLPAGALSLSVGGGPEDVLIILDTSSSMDEAFETSTKIVAAKQVLTDVVSELPEGIDVGLRIFGGCEFSRLLLPVGPLDRAALHAQIQAIETGGPTPIAYTLQQAEGDFSNPADSKLVLLVSDGMETCHGNPVSAARELVASWPSLHIDVVGFNVAGQSSAVDQLRQIAETTQGTYYSAQSSEQLRIALQSAIRMTYQVFDDQGQKVFEGVLGETGPQLPSGTYRVVILTSPPLVLENVNVQSGQTTQIKLNRTDAGYTAETQ